jgi:hypothetical protein
MLEEVILKDMLFEDNKIFDFVQVAFHSLFFKKPVLDLYSSVTSLAPP